MRDICPEDLSYLYAYLAKLPFIIILCWLVIRWGYKKTVCHPACASTAKPKTSTSALWRVLLGIMLIGAFLSIGSLASNAWNKGDEWVFMWDGAASWLERLYIAAFRYMAVNSRFGEFLGTVIGFSDNRWEVWVTLAPMAALAPLAFFQLTRKPGMSLWTPAGAAFYAACFCLCLMGVYLPYWRNYSCYAAGINYLCPTVICIYFLSYFRTDQINTRGTLSTCLVAFLTGLIAGWATESFSATLLPFLTVWVLYLATYKPTILPWRSYWGYAGFLAGCFALFASPALHLRNAKEITSAGNIAATLSPDEMQHFLQHLTPEAIENLRGASGIVALRDFPLLDHIYFVPYWAEYYWSCCYIVALTFAALVCLILLTKGRPVLRTIGTGAGWLVISWLCAASYLVSCIPTRTSFLPAGFLMIAGCAYLFLRLRWCWLQACVTAILAAIAGWIFIPAGIEAATYKKYETARYQRIKELRDAGVRVIDLDVPYPCPPKDPLSLITLHDISDTYWGGSNPVIANHFNVEKVRQKRSSTDKEKQP